MQFYDISCTTVSSLNCEKRFDVISPESVDEVCTDGGLLCIKTSWYRLYELYVLNKLMNAQPHSQYFIGSECY